ncbi:thioredoxin family protein [Micromonospora sicca]|uniref:Thioredoxin family protein n=1 Tax=Micromonospora sicca TaxID=2202420 RepID=A0A317DBK5_9ACTN|nr:thioredoxin family protein [Micromonospora sp. 4G51]
MDDSLVIEILYFDGCPNYEGLEGHVRALLTEAGVELPITVRRIDSDAEAKAERFLGSPTIRVNGIDVDPTAAPRDTYGLLCRVYPTGDGLRGTPPDAWILAALQRQPPGGRAG